MILRKRWQQLFLLTVSFLTVACMGVNHTDSTHETRQETEHKSINPPDLGETADNVHRRWFSNGVVASETMFAHGKKNGRSGKREDQV